MSVISSVFRSEHDQNTPIHKSYWGFDFQISLVDVRSIRKKDNPSPTEKRMLGFDLSEKEPIEKIVVLNNSNNKTGRFTTEQIRDVLNDLGFNVNPTFGGKHLSDIEAVMNINGYSIPGWVWLARTFAKLMPSREKLLLTKLSPGRDRLHVIAYEQNDGSWAFATHTDYNWLNLNLPKIYKAHIGHGGGDYITGTLMFYHLLTAFGETVRENRILPVKEVEKIIQDSYNESIREKFR